MKKVSAIIINYNTAVMTEKVIKGLLASEKAISWELILIDNNSAEKIPLERFEKLSCKIILNKENKGFAKAVNQGLAIAHGDYVLLLNSDCLLDDGCVRKLIGNISSSAGMVGPQMLFPDGLFQSSFGVFPSLGSELLRFTWLKRIFPGGTFASHTFFKKINLKKSSQVDWVSGACMLISREVLNKIPKLDEHYFFGVEDIDYCLQAQRFGFITKYCPEAQAIHHHGYSSGKGGVRSIRRIANDRDGLDYFFRKNFPKKYITRFVVKILHQLKIKALS